MYRPTPITDPSRRHRFRGGLLLFLILTWIRSADTASFAGTQRADEALTVTNYELAWSPDLAAGKLTGICTLTIKRGGEGSLSTVPLYLYRTLTVTSVADGEGRELPFTQRVMALPDWPERQVNAVDVLLAEPLLADRMTKIRIHYQGFLLGYAELGMLYIKDHVDKEFTILRTDCDAYPQPRGESWETMIQAAIQQQFDYRIEVTVPGTLTVANGGELVEKRADGDKSTWVYRNSKPAWRIDVAIADYVVLESEGSKVFAFLKHESGGRKVLEALQSTLNLYSGFFGPLGDFRGFAVIEIPDGWGSQADVTSIIQTAAAFENPDDLVELYHEVAHQWNVTSLDPAPCRVESEGFATFMQYLTEEKLTGKSDALTAGIERLRASVQRRFEKEPGGAAVPMAQFGQEKITNLSYTKGGVFFAALYRLTGPEAFNQIIRQHYQRYASTGATLDDFVQTCRAVAGDKLDRLFDDWLFGAKSSEFFKDGLSLEQIAEKYRK